MNSKKQAFIIRPRDVVNRLGVALGYVPTDRASRVSHEKEWNSNLSKDPSVSELGRWINDVRAEQIALGVDSNQTASGAILVELDQSQQVRLLEISDHADVFRDGPLSLVQSVFSGPEQPTIDATEAVHLRQLDLFDAANARRPWTGRGVVVAVVDTGINSTHAEIAGKTRGSYIVENGRLEYRAGVGDLRDHGTGVASLINGSTCGVAPDCEVVDVNVGYGGEILRSDMVSTFGWLRRQAAISVANISIGFTGGVDPLMQIELEALVRLGIIPIAAVGNDGYNTCSPGNVLSVISVGAYDGAAQLVPSWSGRGIHGPNQDRYSVPFCVAPGVKVWMASSGGGFHQSSGTSFAAPLVAGLTARMLEESNRLIPMGELLVMLEERCRAVPGVQQLAQGRGLVQG